jgi:hypothetical protein
MLPNASNLISVALWKPTNVAEYVPHVTPIENLKGIYSQASQN